MLELDHSELKRWLEHNGDNIYNLNYSLNENSSVFEIGGFKGRWVEQIIQLYNPYIYIIEPIPKYYNELKIKFSKNPKVKILNVGVGLENKFANIYNIEEYSSIFIEPNNDTKLLKVEFNTFDLILKKFNLNKIDLCQINIEGSEYDLMNYLLETNLIEIFDNIQIQFHLGIENAINRRLQIVEDLKNKNFNSKFSYPFVWEGWERK